MVGNKNQVYKALCPMCGTRCGIDVEVRDDVIIKVSPMAEHLFKRLCVKSQGLPELWQSRFRLLHPLKKSNGSWKRITWDEAMDTIVSKLNEVKEEYGPESVFIYFGHALFNKETIGLVQRFAEAFGTPNICNAGCLCESRKILAGIVTYGGQYFHDVGRAKCILHWGMNLIGAQAPAKFLYKDLKERGKKLIVVDPRVTYEAKMADLYLQPRPGTDLALLLAIINVIISEALHDKEYVEKYTLGFDKLAEAVKVYTPEKAAEISSVPAEKIVECARMYATNKPATFGTFAAMEQTSRAFQCHRASAILMAITGNIGVEGGNRVIPVPPPLLSWPFHNENYKLKTKTFTADRLPLWERIVKDANGNYLAETILTNKPYPIRAGIIQAGNPALTYLDSNKFKRAMESLDFLIVHDIVMSETAQLADIVLPAAIGIESTYSHAYIWAGLALLAVSQKIFEPAGECWNDSMFWLELGKKMGYTDFFPWMDTDEIIEKEVLAPYDKTLKDMEATPGGFFYVGKTERVHEKEGFKTPSGKVELYSVMLEGMGLPPLPIPYEEPLESPISTPDLFKEYPLIGISGIRKEIYEQSTGRYLPIFRRRAPDPEIEIHPKDAEKNNIKNGEWVIIESPRGKVTMKARVTEDIKEGVVAMPHGWGGDGNVNRLTNDEVLDPITAASVSRGFACRVRRID